MSFSAAASKPVLVAAFGGVAIGALLAAAIARFRTVPSSNRSVDTATSPEPVAAASPVNDGDDTNNDHNDALSSAHEEIDGLMSLLQSRDQTISSLQQDCLQLKTRIFELENPISPSPSPSSSTWSHVYPTSDPLPLLPSILRHTTSTPAIGVLFDLDGTLVESSEIWYKLLNACSEHLGYGPLERSLWLPTFGQSMNANRTLFFPRSSQEEVDNFCDEHYGDYVQHLEILPGALEALEATKKFVGIERMAICTNCPAPITRIIIESVPELSQYFSAERTICAGSIIHVKRGREDHTLPRYQMTQEENDAIDSGMQVNYKLHAKPSTDIIIRACSILHTDPKQCLFVGDSKFDIMAAMAAESFAIGIGEKGRGGNMHIDNIGQLPEKLQ